VSRNVRGRPFVGACATFRATAPLRVADPMRSCSDEEAGSAEVKEGILRSALVKTG
jgi:hypothetical protein